MQAKKSSSQKVKVSEKRSIDDGEVGGSRKRVRFVRSHLRNQSLAIKSTSQLDSTVIEHSNDTNGDAITATDELQLQDANRWSNSLPLRSGRHIRPLARFRQISLLLASSNTTSEYCIKALELQTTMWLSNSKKYAMDGFLDERARSGIVHEVVGYGSQNRYLTILASILIDTAYQVFSPSLI